MSHALLAGLLLLAIASPAIGQEKKPMKKILVLTFSGGFKHSCLEIAEQTIGRIGKESGVFEAECLNLWQLKSDLINVSYLTPEYLSRYDGYLFYTTTGENVKFTDEQKKGLLDLIKSGKAYIGIHASSDSFYNWAEYGKIAGGFFSGHPWGANSDPVTIKVEDKNHPATKMLGDSWTIQDEIYQFKESYSRKDLHILLSLDNAKTDMDKENLLHGKDGDYAVAWCHEYGKGRCFYTSLGHREDVWTNPTYQAHLLGGIKWALGLEEGDSSPSEK
jgi:hypothetical protein